MLLRVLNCSLFNYRMYRAPICEIYGILFIKIITYIHSYFNLFATEVVEIFREKVVISV